MNDTGNHAVQAERTKTQTDLKLLYYILQDREREFHCSLIHTKNNFVEIRLEVTPVQRQRSKSFRSTPGTE